MLAYAFHKWDPKPMRKRYAWERRPDENEDMEEDPVIGDQWRAGYREIATADEPRTD